MPCGLWRLLAPEPVDEVVAGNHLVAVQQQDGEKRPLSRPAEGHLDLVTVHLQRTEDTEPHEPILGVCEPIARFLRGG